MDRLAKKDREETDDTLVIDICICTFRRPHVAETLRSISRFAPRPNLAIRIIVADNDETPSAKALVARTAKECSLDVRYVHAPSRNISIARNACLDIATAPLVLFVDDDEKVTAAWPHALLAKIAETDADAVLGPVQSIYDSRCPVWMRRGDFHSPKPAWIGDELATGYSCNVLFKRGAQPFRGLRFLPELGRTGGEDSFFFSQAHRAGARLAFASEAVVTEDVPPDRARLSWLVRRYFRSGQTHGRWLLHCEGSAPRKRAKHLALAGGKVMVCVAAAFCSLFSLRRVVFWILRGSMHAGVVTRLLGQRELELYGQAG